MQLTNHNCWLADSLQTMDGLSFDLQHSLPVKLVGKAAFTKPPKTMKKTKRKKYLHSKSPKDKHLTKEKQKEKKAKKVQFQGLPAKDQCTHCKK